MVGGLGTFLFQTRSATVKKQLACVTNSETTGRVINHVVWSPAPQTVAAALTSASGAVHTSGGAEAEQDGSVLGNSELRDGGREELSHLGVTRNWKDVKWRPGHRRSLPRPSDTFIFFLIFAFRHSSRELPDQAVPEEAIPGFSSVRHQRPTDLLHRSAHRFNHEDWRSWSRC